MVVTDDEDLARRVRHLSTTAKQPHRWAFDHDDIGYNYRMPNINAALGLAQMDRLDALLASKREVAHAYRDAAAHHRWCWIAEPPDARSNYWLNALRLPDRQACEALLAATNDAGIQTRPLWTPMHRLRPYRDCPRGTMEHTERLADTVINLPSSPKPSPDH
jgi:dTDP-4-amino-4,6-dideoxygalactose transaminase